MITQQAMLRYWCIWLRVFRLIRPSMHFMPLPTVRSRLSPNSCVIENDKPRFLGVNGDAEDQYRSYCQAAQTGTGDKVSELSEDWHMSSLEKIFIENRIYLSIEECETWESVIETIDRELGALQEASSERGYQG
jgi:hypothetical protein